MAFTQITVTKTWTNPDGSPATGTVLFQLTQQLTDSSTGNSIDPEPITATLSGGAISQVLVANNDPTTQPQSTKYAVTETVSSEANPVYYTIIVPYNAVGHTATLQSCVG